MGLTSEAEQKDKKAENIKKIVEYVNSSDISSIKTIVSGLIAILNDPKSTAKDLKDLIQLDPPISGKILRVANSIYYASQSKVDSIEKAIIWLGYNTVRDITIRQKTSELFSSNDMLEGFNVNDLWKYSVSVAHFAKMIFRREFRDKGDTIYTAGLLHKLGLIAEIQSIKKTFVALLEQSNTSGINLMQLEEKKLGFNHAELGMHITKSWALPDDISEAIAYHSNPYKVSHAYFKNAATLYLAAALCRESDIGYYQATPLDESILRKCQYDLKIDRDGLNMIREEGKQEIMDMIQKGAL